MKLLIIPTLNEKKNITTLFKKIRKIDHKIDILFIDDNSTDGTRQKIFNLSKKNKQIKYIFRKKKLGVGSAHKVGLQIAYKKKYTIAITMDADGTHNPKYIPILLRHNKNNPIVNVFFRDLYPIAMSALDYNQQATDVEYLTATVDFAYQIYEIEPIV